MIVCPGSLAPVSRGAFALCLCGQKFTVGDDRRVPSHERPVSPVPWEPLTQVDAAALPDCAPSGLPTPWTTHGRGNGHYDVLAADGQYIAHVYCWETDDYDRLEVKIDRVNGLGPKPRPGETWRLSLGTVNFDYVVLGLGADMTVRPRSARAETFVMLRGLGHGDNVVELADFRRRFTRIAAAKD